MVDWDKRYAEADAPMFGGVANNYVVQTACDRILRRDRRSAWRMVMAATVAIWPSRGWRSPAVDISRVGTDQAMALDASAGVRSTRSPPILRNGQPAADDTWDAVFLIYLHCEREVRQRAVELAARHLAPVAGSSRRVSLLTSATARVWVRQIRPCSTTAPSLIPGSMVLSSLRR